MSAGLSSARVGACARASSENRRGGAFRLIDGVLHAFEADAVEHAVGGLEPRAIAGSQDRGIGRAREFVDDDAVPHVETGGLRECGIWRDADADEDEIGLDTRARGEVHGGDLAVAAFDLAHACVEVHGGAETAVEVQEVFRQRGAADAPRETVAELDDIDGDAQTAREAGDFQADHAAADDDDAARGLQARADEMRVVEAAQGEDAVEIGAGHG